MNCNQGYQVNADRQHAARSGHALTCKHALQRLCVTLVMLGVIAAGPSRPSHLVAAEPVDFQQTIRPLLAQHCFTCHGPDEESREADLRLDERDSAVQSKAIVPGNASESELLARVAASDPDIRMPPPKHGAPLNPEQVEALRLWVDQGAEYAGHWAFQAPAAPPLPSVQNPAWCANGVDRFVLASLEARQMEPSERADRYTLARRVYFDLTGLPPTPAQADQFAQDDDPLAYERLVDRLLASPRYGERWARPWLDLARYADTNGYEKDRARSIWPYRDWVIAALNADLPYDQFSVEQLAGDMFAQPTLQQRIATGFHRNTMINEEGGIDPLEYRYYAMVDRVATTGLVWLGLTTGCAQCHSHKYDPISHTDYYAFMGLLNNADEPEMLVADEAVVAKRRAIQAEIDQREQQLPSRFPVAEEGNEGVLRPEAAFESAFQQWVVLSRQRAVDWRVIRPSKMSTNLPRLEVLPDDSIFSTGDITKRDKFRLEFTLQPSAEPLTALRLEVLPDDRLPAGGPGRAYYEGRKGDFFLSEVDAHVVADGEDQRIDFVAPSHSFGQLSIGSGDAKASNVLDGNGSTGWSTSGREGEPSRLVLPLSQPLVPTAGQKLVVELLFERHFAASLGRFRVSVTSHTPRKLPDAKHVPKSDGAGDEASGPSSDQTPTPHVSASQMPVEVEAVLASSEDWTPTQVASLKRYFARVAPELAEARKQIDALRKRMPSLPATLVLQERPADNPRPTHLHHRGEYLSPKQQVRPSVPEFLRGEQPGPTNRMEFARWLVSPENPLVARVAVNRAWRHFWGAGLVRTSGDFGTQSEPPTHPELLDFLATEFMRHGWSSKWLHREIVLSAAYQQQSDATPTSFATDPGNRLLARGPRFRLPAEMVRDMALQASNLLSTREGGPSVYPPQPASVTQLAYGGGNWTPSKGGDRYRRSLYTFSKRTAPFAAYSVFDGPSGEACTARRGRSNTPLQALTLLNDPMFWEAAEALGREAHALDARVDAGIRLLFQRVLTRPPAAEEIEALEAYYTRQVQRMEKGELKATEIADGSIPQAAWTMTARIILNLDEAITKP